MKSRGLVRHTDQEAGDGEEVALSPGRGVGGAGLDQRRDRGVESERLPEHRHRHHQVHPALAAGISRCRYLQYLQYLLT